MGSLIDEDSLEKMLLEFNDSARAWPQTANEDYEPFQNLYHNFDTADMGAAIEFIEMVECRALEGKKVLRSPKLSSPAIVTSIESRPPLQDAVPQLPPSRRRAYQQYQQVVSARADLYDDLKRAYDYYCEHFHDSEDGVMVKKESWVDYVQQAMRHQSTTCTPNPPSVKDLPQDRNRDS